MEKGREKEKVDRTWKEGNRKLKKEIAMGGRRHAHITSVFGGREGGRSEEEIEGGGGGGAIHSTLNNRGRKSGGFSRVVWGRWDFFWVGGRPGGC